MKIVNDFEEYTILDMADGEKLEKWNKFVLLRPDPQIIWDEKRHPELWNKVDAIYHRSNTGGGHWEVLNSNLKNWQIKYQDMTFNLKLMNFKHTGLFPEQAYNWNIIRKTIKLANRPVKVLNLFAYTGGASVAALMENASVVHVDSSRGMIDWAKENTLSSKVNDKNIRFIVDDCVKFVKREIRRGNKYDIILMDPPSFGRGAKNEVWTLEKELFNLVKLCNELLSSDPLLFIINSYTTGLSKTVLEDILRLTVMKDKKGFLDSDELGIKEKESELILPCGIYARFSKYHLD